MMPYIRRVTEQPTNWMVHSTALLLKSRLESEAHRTIERAALQTQALVDQFDDDPESKVNERMSYLFALPFPSRWSLKEEVGKRFLSMGSAATALQVFEELEMWEDIIDCYRVMNKTNKAEQVVRQRLNVEPSPLLWCLLGDLTDDISLYEKAWELSGKRFSRAQRSLGHAAIRKEEWEKAAHHYELALAINPLYPNVWFALGCALMRFEQWEKAINAFSRTTQIDPDQGEAWNNMATIYLKLKKKREAFILLQEALRYMRSSWRIWQNFLFVSVDIGEFGQAINAVNELLELQEQRFDTEVLSLLCSVVTKDTKDANGTPGSHHKKAVDQMLANVESKISTNPKVWEVFAQYHADLGDVKKQVEYREKQYRASQKPGWESDRELFELFAKGTSALVRSYMAVGDKASLYSARTKLRSLIKKSEDTFGSEDIYRQLESLLEEVKGMEEALK